MSKKIIFYALGLISLCLADSGAVESAYTHIPAGRFRDELIALSPGLRQQVLERVEALKIPENDFESLRIHPGGKLHYVCDFGRTSWDQPPLALGGMVKVMEVMVFTNAVPVSSPPLFHSRPGSTNILFLDFNGHVVTNTAWNSYPDFATPFWDCRPYGIDLDETTFSVVEQQAIQTIWERVSEDYAPFDIDVTTEQPLAWNRYVGHLLITPDTDKNGEECPHFNAGGIAFVDVFGDAEYSYDFAGECFSPAWVLNYELSGFAEYEAEAASHEMGHNLALSHDGTKQSSYYGGHDNGSISWGPIMGTGYDQNVSQWSKGDYRLSNNPQDDLAILASQMGYRPDDFGNDHASAEPLSIGATGTVFHVGVVEQNTDEDVFRFTASSGTVDLVVSPYRDGMSTTWGGNLDVILELYDAAGVLMATNNPPLETLANLMTVVSNGTYYLHIKPVGVGTPLSAPTPTGYVQYGSLGQYTIVGDIVIPLDLDGDGLPNEWEFEYFGDLTNAISFFDSDGDGHDNFAEYISGFDPANSSSVFEVTSFTAPPSGNSPFILTWNPVEGRIYDVRWSDGLVISPFMVIGANLPYTQSSYTDTVERTSLQNFYRVDVRLAE